MFLSPPIRKQVVCLTWLSRVLLLITIKQIIEEQLAFPSGTATAQLISVLHNVTPPSKDGPALERRRGYSALRDEDTTIEVNTRNADVSGEAPEQDEEREIARRDGWSALGWSFAVSATMTVRCITIERSIASLMVSTKFR